MGNILLIHPHEKDKVTFFSSISKFLNQKNFNTNHLAFSRLEKEVYNKYGIKNVYFMPRKLLKYSCQLSSSVKKFYDIEQALKYTIEFNEINGYTYKKNQLYSIAAKYINFLIDLNKTQKIDMVITWNETFMFDSLAKQFAQINGIEIRMFEAGIFRPHTVTIDPQGINYGNSIPMERDFYSKNKQSYEFGSFDNIADFEINGNEYHSIQIPKLKRYFLKERLKDKLHNQLLKDELELEVIKEGFLKKTKKIIKKKAELPKLGNKENNVQIEGRYIFVPFQVHDDSQIVLNSPQIKDMEDLVRVMSGAIKNLNKSNGSDYKVVFKEHPADQGRVDYSDLYKKHNHNEDLIFLTSGNTDDLIENSDLVITVNSTVGIEALKHHKPVITLGNAYYNIEGIAHYCGNLSTLHLVIEKAIKEEVDVNLVNSFLNYLRYEYQIEGDFRKGILNKKQLEYKMLGSTIN
ncbi:hypothetical protein [Pseudalkalibacillus hwajinpoensis]|uniref:capsular polysaccharide export protein, LipB/KpsS family n=1 Tax=Guptibacillus hwajinpoensis TaxID=208199 RepID=UPI001CFD8E84|nr:hypothetical protein [Pseudalkalibacillus hwajinpoensis]